MKIIRTIIVYGALGVSLFFVWDTFLRSACSRVIEYDIGDFDERFGIDRDDFLKHIKNAETPWEEVVNKDLFNYVPGAKFKINLIWSEEQARIYKGNNLEKDLNSVQHSIDSVQTRYDSAIKKYESARTAYEQKLANYEKEVSYWNDQGGAPSPEYEELKKQASTLDNQATEVNRLLRQANKLAEENNKSIKNYNNGVSEYNSLFNKGYEFDAGNTDGTEINVYTYGSIHELETLLIHEFGHVLGIEHVDNDNSVMYYLLNEKNEQGRLTDVDIAALQESCRI